MARVLLAVLASCSVLLTPAVAPAAGEKQFVIENGTWYDMRAFYAHSAFTEESIDNLLAEGALLAGGKRTLTIADDGDHCLYDIRAIFQDDEIVVDVSVDMCSLRSYRYEIVDNIIRSEPVF